MCRNPLRAGAPVALDLPNMQRLRRQLDELSREWREVRYRHPRLAIAILSVAALAAIAPFVLGTWFVMSLFQGLPDMDAIRRIGEMDQATAVYDDADKLAFTIYKEQRIDVPLSSVSPHAIRALTSIEDQRFYEHRGFDLVRIGSAALANIRHRRAVQGASTLTQQLARQSFLTPDKTLRRKLQELILAARIESMYTKPQILELYLNKVYFGDGLYGIEAASRGYLDKHASELNIADAALLAGLVKSPSSYAPTVSMERAVARRNRVLQAMLEEGAIDRAAWKSAQASKVVLRDGLRVDEPHGQYFKEQVRIELVQRFGWQRVYQGGLRVFSTVNMPLQIAAENAVAESLKSLEQRRAVVLKKASAKTREALEAGDTDPLQAALISMDVQTGHVRAMVGGRDFEASHFNRAVQAHRQPGSAFKPFVYATALESGYSPASVIDHLDDPIATPQGGWTPEDEHSGASSMTLRTALRTSSNRAAVRLLQQVGIRRTVQYAKQLGVGDVPAVPSLALGAGEVTLQSMTAAYAAFANDGLVPKAQLIRRVEDKDGRVLYQSSDVATPAITRPTAFLMANMMADVINAGTAWRARQLGFTAPAAGKTGTTNDFHDAWFVGFTPKVVTGVWVGFDQPRTILPNGFAADVAVPLWTAFMKVATKDDKPEWLSMPPGITTLAVCRLSGKLATDNCRNAPVVDADGTINDRRSMVYNEYFVRGTEPRSYCDVHNGAGIMTRIASVFGADDHPSPHVDGAGTSVPAPPPPMVGSAPPPVAHSPDEPTSAAQPPQPKRRGFFSRIFGIGRDRESKNPDVTAKKKGGN
jgi:1A family penicillin-binding protein